MIAQEILLSAQIEKIAREKLGIPVLSPRHSEQLDVHPVEVSALRKALEAAVELGRKLQKEQSD